jgi:hypothetical protein
MHLGLRLAKHRAEQLKRLVDHANAVASANGLPSAFTASALVVAQMNTWLDAECAKLDATAKRKR